MNRPGGFLGSPELRVKNMVRQRGCGQRLRWQGLLLGLLLVTGCGQSAINNPIGSPVGDAGSSNQQKAKKTVRVQLAFLFQSVDAPLILAINKGYFAAEGLEIAYERGFGNVDAISKLGTGNFDLSFSDMYNALDFNDKNPQNKIKAVAVPFNQAAFAVVTLKERGINGPKDLVGKNLGAPAGDGPRKLFPLFAQQAGIDSNSITWTSIEPKLRETFLLQGKVDAITGFTTSTLPNLLKAGKKQEEIKVFYYKDYGLDFYGNGILAQTRFIEQNPQVIQGFVRAYLRGLQDLLKDPMAALDAVIAADQSKLLNRETEKVRLQVAIDHLILSPEVEKLGLGAVDPDRLSRSIQLTARGFRLRSNPSVADIYTDRFLPPLAERGLPSPAERRPLR